MKNSYSQMKGAHGDSERQGAHTHVLRHGSLPGMKCSTDGYHHVDCTDEQLSLQWVLNGARHSAQILTELVHHPYTHKVAGRDRRRGEEGGEEEQRPMEGSRGSVWHKRKQSTGVHLVVPK